MRVVLDTNLAGYPANNFAKYWISGSSKFKFLLFFFHFSLFFSLKNSCHCSQYLQFIVYCYRIFGIWPAGYEEKENGYLARYQIPKKAGYPVQPNNQMLHI